MANSGSAPWSGVAAASLVQLPASLSRRPLSKLERLHAHEDASLRYTGIESHEGLTHYGLYDTVVGSEWKGNEAPARARELSAAGVSQGD